MVLDEGKRGVAMYDDKGQRLKKGNCGTEGGEKKTRKRTKSGSIDPMLSSPS